jgi:UV DNA damage repair endonuclease
VIAHARLGFCCTYVAPQPDPALTAAMNMRTVTMAWLARQTLGAAYDRLVEVVSHNLDVLDRQIAHVAGMDRLERMFRIVSNFLPGWSHPTATPLYDADLVALIERRLAAAGNAARTGDVRLSMHPAQHAILATLRDEALANAIVDIMDHVAVFAMMGYSGWHPYGAHINIHGGAGSIGIDGVRHGLARLPSEARDLVTIENDEMSFGLDDLLQVADDTAIVVDFHHHWIKSRGEWLMPGDPRVARLIASWRGVRPAAHVSVSREVLYSELISDELPDYAALSAAGFKASELRGHSDLMWNTAVNDLVARHLAWCDVEVEAKSKNLASAGLAAHVRAFAT